MSQAVAFGSITVIDVTDISEFSVQPMSNLPLSVIYDPDQDNFTPNWGSSTLRVTPAVYYGGSALTLGSTGLTVTWQRQVGTGAVSSLTTDESVVSGGILEVTANKFTSSSTMLTYIVTATYVEPTSQQTLTAQGQITYSLIKNASTAKTASIIGDSFFKYNGDGTAVGATSITLTAKVSNVTITAWQYQNGSGVWTTYPNSGTSSTLTVNNSDTVFFNDKCLIRLTTNDNNVYDLHAITKLRDGAAGSLTVSAVLTNDDQMIPFNSQGTGDFSSATSQIIIYEGGIDTTASWTIAQSYDNVTATPSTTTAANDTVSVTAMSTSSGNVTFTCTRQGYDTITKSFSLVKVTSGADGVTPTIYSVEADALALNKSTAGALTPASVTFSAFSQNGTTKSAYSGRFRIVENYTVAEYDAASPKPTPAYSSTGNESSHTYTPSTSATTILVMLYEAGAFTKRLDTQLVVVTSDGEQGVQGEQGEDGQSAVNITLGNYADVLTCTSSNTLIAQQIIKIPFAAYEGITRIPCTFTSVKLCNINPAAIGTGTNNSKNATASADGQIVWVLPAGTSVTSPNGVLSITFTATASTGTVQKVENYSWSRSTAAANAVLLQIYTPSGTNILTDTVTSTTLQAQLTEGSTDVTSSATSWQWAKFQSGSYTNISGATSSSYTVQRATVDSYASFRLTGTYNSNNYVAYFSVFDKTDPIQVSVLSSVGTQLVNGAGYGALYVKVSRNGAEIDSIKSERFLTSNPSTAATGDYYYKLDRTNKGVLLMKYNGATWVDVTETEQYTGSYNWSWRDKDGNVVSVIGGNTLPISGKVVYIDGDMVDGKIIADVEVTI